MGLFDRAAEVIDGSWHHSWHWEQRNGHLTLEGVRKAIVDCEFTIAGRRRRAAQAEAILAELQQRESELAQSEES